MEETARLCEALGHHVEPFDFDYDFAKAWEIYTRVISVQTAWSFDGMIPVFGRAVREDEVTRATWTGIERGRATSGVQHTADIEAMRGIGRRIATMTGRFDAVILPALPQGTRPLGFYDMSLDIETYNATVMGEDNVYMAPFNISGQPAMSLPLGETASGLPLGVQIVGCEGDEATLFRLAGQLEVARPWRHRRPALHAATS